MVLPFPSAEKSLGPNYPKLTAEELEYYRSQINCNFEQLDAVFEDCMMEAKALLSEQGIKDYLDGASLVTMIGRGFDPILTTGSPRSRPRNPLPRFAVGMDAIAHPK